MKKIIYLTGPSCVGKTTISQLLMQRIPNTYLVSYDQLKMQLTGYDREEHRDVMRRLTLGYLDTVCAEGFFIFVELWHLSQEDVESIQNIADTHDYELLAINLTAPDDVILRRSQERIDDAIADGIQNSIMDIEIYRKALKVKEYLPKASLQIDTVENSSGEIAEKILKALDL